MEMIVSILFTLAVVYIFFDQLRLFFNKQIEINKEEQIKLAKEERDENLGC